MSESVPCRTVSYGIVILSLYRSRRHEQQQSERDFAPLTLPLVTRSVEPHSVTSATCVWYLYHRRCPIPNRTERSKLHSLSTFFVFSSEKAIFAREVCLLTIHRRSSLVESDSSRLDSTGRIWNGVSSQLLYFPSTTTTSEQWIA